MRTRLVLAFIAVVLVSACGTSQRQTIDTAATPAAAAAPPPGLQDNPHARDGINKPAEPPPAPVFTRAEEAAAEGTPDKATKEERADKVLRLNGENGNQFLTPPPKAVKARHNSKEAKAAAEGPGDLSPEMKTKGPSKAVFGLFSDQFRDIGPDGKEANGRVNVPAWVVTFEDVPVAAGGPPALNCLGPPVEVGEVVRGSDRPSADCFSEKPATMGTVHYVVDDSTGKALKSITLG